jgi:membrane-associated protease RseP (regulator of RpoE activity)
MTLLALMFVANHALGLAALLATLGALGTVQLAQGAFTPDAITKLLAGDFLAIAASGAVNPHVSARYVITKAGIAALTLAAPIAGAEDGTLIEITSTTAFAHTLTATGLLRNGAGTVNLATFAANDGAAILLCAYNGKWYVQMAQGVTIT